MAGPPTSILDAYQAERWPITEQVSRFAMSHAEREIKRRGAVSPLIEAPGPEGDAVRAAAGKLAYEINPPQYAGGGLNSGYYYDASPIIAYDGGDTVLHHGRFHAVDRAGMPHAACLALRPPLALRRDGRRFALLRSIRTIDVGALERAAREKGVPLRLLDVDAPDTASGYDGKLVLSRPDQHVAWRGESLPADPVRLIDRVRGAAEGAAR